MAFHERIEERIAELLVSDGVVARCAGRMEFGARALGNRSILANPSDHRVVGLINRMIKNRDFWMPFAPDSARGARGRLSGQSQGLRLALHDAGHADPPRGARRHHGGGPPTGRHRARRRSSSATGTRSTTRSIREFERRTGVGAVLNTSFNLHGEPIVRSAEDAVDTFERSGLPHLAVGRWLISKK